MYTYIYNSTYSCENGGAQKFWKTFKDKSNLEKLKFLPSLNNKSSNLHFSHLYLVYMV